MINVLINFVEAWNQLKTLLHNVRCYEEVDAARWTHGRDGAYTHLN